MATHNLHPVMIRQARQSDVDALVRLAELDSKRKLDGELLVAESEGVLLAALDPESGASVADPFKPTAELVELLRHHSRSRAHQRRRISLRRPHTA